MLTDIAVLRVLAYKHLSLTDNCFILFSADKRPPTFSVQEVLR